MTKKAILLSGGMDSIALSFLEKPQIALTLNYGQRAAQAELAAALKVSEVLGMEHYAIQVDCSELGSGDMSNKAAIAVAPKSDWWPYRNQMLITLSAMKAISLEVSELLVGSVKTDGYHTDGSIQFFNQIDDLMSMQEGGLRVRAPAIDMSTAELILKSGIKRDLLMWAHSCHKSSTPCGSCRGCNKYYEVLEMLGASYE